MLVRVPDPIFADPRLAELYDAVERERDDLDLYVSIVDELNATRVLDIGCGTGSLACLLASKGVEVIGVDPALASLDVARRKPGAHRVRWVEGDVSRVGAVGAGLAVMTGNVAQVFVDDADWAQTLRATHDAVLDGGWLTFETRDPGRRAWRRWTKEHTLRTHDVPGVGRVTTWTELLDVCEPLVSFRQYFRFPNRSELQSDSTLRFRDRDEVSADLAAAGFRVRSIRDAPDRPGLEFVFVAQSVP